MRQRFSYLAAMISRIFGGVNVRLSNLRVKPNRLSTDAKIATPVGKHDSGSIMLWGCSGTWNKREGIMTTN